MHDIFPFLQRQNILHLQRADMGIETILLLSLRGD